MFCLCLCHIRVSKTKRRRRYVDGDDDEDDRGFGKKSMKKDVALIQQQTFHRLMSAEQLDQMDIDTAITGVCVLCSQHGEISSCCHCEKTACGLCLRQCEACQDVFCSVCSRVKKEKEETKKSGGKCLIDESLFVFEGGLLPEI